MGLCESKNNTEDTTITQFTTETPQTGVFVQFSGSLENSGETVQRFETVRRFETLQRFEENDNNAYNRLGYNMTELLLLILVLVVLWKVVYVIFKALQKETFVMETNGQDVEKNGKSKVCDKNVYWV